VPGGDTSANTSIEDLAGNLAGAVEDAGLEDRFIVEVIQTALGPRLALTASYDFNYSITYAEGGKASELGFRSGQNNLIRAPEMGVYQLIFSSDLGSTTMAGGADAEAVLLVVGSDEDPFLASFRPIAIGLGDIDNSGIGTYVAAVSDDLQAGTSLLLLMPGVTDFSDLSIASDSDRRFLRLPAPLMAADNEGRQAFILQPGDYNGDGIKDIAVLVTGPGGAVYVIAGEDSTAPGYQVPAEITDLAAESDLIIRGETSDLGAEVSVNPAPAAGCRG